MKIVVNDIAASEGGALSVLLDFYEAVKQYDLENEYIFLLSKKHFEETERIKILLLPEVKQSHLKKIIFDFITGKKLIKSLNPDIVFSLQNIITFGLKKTQIVYVHQSLPYQSLKKFSFFKTSERKYAIVQYIIGSIINCSVRKAEKVIVQTEWMKNALIDKTKKASEKIYVIPPTVKGDTSKKVAVFDKHRFFYPTSDYVYKNNDLLMKVAEELMIETTEDFVVEMTLPEQESGVECVKYVGRLSREEVINKYRESTLVFPSYIETYGMPLAEARTTGTIILAARCNYAYEVLEGYENAYFFDYDKPQELAALMKAVLQGKIVKKEIVETFWNDETWKDVIKVITEE